MYDKIIKFLEATMDYFLHPVNEELFSTALKLHHEIKKRNGAKVGGEKSGLRDALYRLAGRVIPLADINRLIEGIDRVSLDKWSVYIMSEHPDYRLHSSPSYTSSSNTASSS